MGARRFHEQKWLIDAVIATVGLDWDQLRMATTVAPAGFEGMGDWAAISKQIRRYDEITPSFAEFAEHRESRAKKALAAGDLVTARESFLIASLYNGVAQWPIDEINDLNKELNRRKVECYSKYAEVAHHRIERVDIPMGDKMIPGWLHLPVNPEGPYPVVIMLSGMDTFKEKLVWAYGDKILERGMAALAIDGPGQSEALVNGLFVTADNYGDTGRACVKFIDGHKELDGTRIGVFGRSFGSYAGTVMGNAIADRTAGVAVVMPLHEPGFYSIFEEASPTFKNRFMYMSNFTDEKKFDEFIKGFDLRGKVADLKCPYLVVGGDLDGSSPIKHSYELSRHVPGPVELFIYQNEGHAPGRGSAGQKGPHWYSMMADWLAARVRDRKPQTERRFTYVKLSGALEDRPMP